MSQTLTGLRSLFDTDGTLISGWLSSGAPAVAELLAYAGFDMVVIDMEHSPISVRDAGEILRALDAAGCPALVRTASDDRVQIKQLLDLGATNLMVPMVETAEQAIDIVSATRYPPHGVRGFAARHRASKFGFDPEYPSQANSRITLVAQLETTAALASLESIAAIDGIDAVFFGPGDLSADLGLLGQASDHRVLDTILEANLKAKGLGIRTGVLCPTLAWSEALSAANFDFIVACTDLHLLATSVRDALSRFRG